MVIYKIYPAKACKLNVKLFIVFVMNDSGDSTNRLVVFVSKPIFRFAEIECRIFVFAECLKFIVSSSGYLDRC